MRRAVQLETTDGNPWSAGVAKQGRWLRGNLHCHTSESDGRLSPQQAVDSFAGAGYHFLALTDHDRVTDPRTLDSRGMCLLPATELTAAGGELGSTYHLIALGLPAGSILPPKTNPARQSVRWLRERGAVVFIAHPHWSGLTVGDLLAAGVDPAEEAGGAADADGAPGAGEASDTAEAGNARGMGVHGIEIFNAGTVLDSQKGEAIVHWEEALARGARWWGIAVDDTHWFTIDRFAGWVMVRAPEQSPGAVLRALAHGHFYASSGPEIKDVRLTPRAGGATVEVETSPCAAIYALGYGSRNQFAFNREAAARGEVGGTITGASFMLDRVGPGRFIRIQCVDWQRRSAWSNPLFLRP